MSRTGPYEPHPAIGSQSGGSSPTDGALLEALFALAPVGLASWDADLRYRRVNSVLAAINGRPVEAHLGRRVSEVLPELGPRLERILEEVLATGTAQSDLRLSGETPAAAGVTRHWLASYFPVRDEDGVPVGVAATVLETTGEQSASARASDAERLSNAIDAQLRAVYRALPVGVAFVTPDMRYERVNDALARMNGRTVEEHIGRTVREVLGEHAQEAEEVTREVIRRGEPLDVELRMRTPAAPHEERFFAATYFPVFGPGGGVLGVGAVVRDVTDHEAHARERERLLRDSLTARAQAEAAQVRAEAAREETEAALAEAQAQRRAAQAAGRRAAFLARVTGRLAASLDYEATLREVVASAVPYIADWGVVTAIAPNGQVRVLGFGHSDPARADLVSEFAQRYLPGPASSVTTVMRTGKPVIARDVTPAQLAAMAPDPDDLALLERLGVRDFGTWPIPSPDGSVIGALTFVLAESGREFSEADLQTAYVLATRAGLHLTNARLHGERSEIARTLQASLLPRELPEIPSVEIASAFVAAGGENTVGGDFFDVFPTGEDVWTAILGDVTGKGAKAAAITSVVRHTLRAAALVAPDPVENLALLNRVLLVDGEDQPCTVVYARLCPGPGRLAVRIAHAGHPPALVLRADGSVQAVEGGRGPLLGAFPDARFEETELELLSGEVLLLYTDGVTESRPGDLLHGERALATTLGGTRGRSASDVAEAVKSATLRLQGGTARDDIAVLAIRVSPTST